MVTARSACTALMLLFASRVSICQQPVRQARHRRWRHASNRWHPHEPSCRRSRTHSGHYATTQSWTSACFLAPTNFHQPASLGLAGSRLRRQHEIPARGAGLTISVRTPAHGSGATWIATLHRGGLSPHTPSRFLPAHSLALRPAHSRCHQFVTRIPKASAISSPP